jgi:heptosyltransferase-1/heptosyltransferase-2
MTNKILIIKPSSLGDVATTLPLLCDLRSAHPHAQIDWLLHPAFNALVEKHDALHALLPFDRKKLGAWFYKPSSFKALRRLLRTLRKTKYDAVIDAQGLLRSAIFTRLTSAPIRIGFGDAREAAPLAYTHKVWLPEGGKKMLAVDRMRALGKPLGTTPQAPADFRLPLQPAAVEKAAALLPADDFVTIIPGARWNTKRWPLDRYTQIVQNLLAQGDTVLLLGSPDEQPLCDQIQASIENRKSKLENLKNLAGKTDLATMSALLARTRLLIANDSGPLHVAAALATPAVALYGPTNPAFVGPHGQLQNVLRHDVPCFPCRHRDCSHHSCMNGLTTDAVWQKTTELLLPTINGNPTPVPTSK